MPSYSPPVSNLVAPIDLDPIAVQANPLGNRLARYYRSGPRGQNVYLLTSGVATLTQPYDPTDVLIRRTLHGGHLHQVNATEQTAIQTAGLGGTFTSFDPRTSAELLWWVGADQITGLTDGQAVSSWSDASGIAGSLTQTTTTKQPLYKTNIQNGLPVVRFDGVDDLMTVTFPAATPPPYTLIAVVAMTSGTTPILLDGPPSAGVIGSSARGILWSSTGVAAVNGSFTQASQVLFNLAVPTAFSVYSITMDAQVNVTYRQNGAAVAGTVSYPAAAKDFFGREPPIIRGFTVAGRADGAQILGGDFAELALWERALPIDELHALEQDAGTKYGITVA